MLIIIKVVITILFVIDFFTPDPILWVSGPIDEILEGLILLWLWKPEKNKKLEESE